jgi:protein HOOK3
VTSLKEKVRRLQRELNKASNGNEITGTMNKEDSNSDPTMEISLLQQELDDVRAMKKEREEALFAAKRQISELQSELSKLNRSTSEQERHTSIAQKDFSHKLAETANTIRLLEDKLKEKESQANKLVQEKSKLENYTKRSLETFKEKYMVALQSMKEEKRELENRLKMVQEKAEANEEIWRRDERLLSSAIFEVGVRIMDRTIQSQATPFSRSS